jgi:ubiquinol-cytochrome c reductase iron-sulfur subunit
MSRWIAVCFSLTVLAAVFIGVVYVVGGETWLLGLGFAVAFAGLAGGLALWAAYLLPQGPYVEEREAMTSPPESREALESEFERDERPVTALALPRRILTLALGALGVAALFPIRSLFRGPSPDEALAVTAWRDGVRAVNEQGRPVRPSDVQPGTMVTIYPEGHTDAVDAAAVLLRVDPARLAPGTARGSVEGLLAYSKICTHAGCPVGMYVTTTQQLVCPCHQSVFDVLRGAEPLAGPAARPLPQLPLRVDGEGSLVAAGDYPVPAGPGYWRKA